MSIIELDTESITRINEIIQDRIYGESRSLKSLRIEKESASEENKIVIQQRIDSVFSEIIFLEDVSAKLRS